MLARLSLLAALAGCSAPQISSTIADDNPASPDAKPSAFIRPVNVLADAPLAAPAPGTVTPGASMAGMKGMDHGAMPGRAMPGMAP